MKQFLHEQGYRSDVLTIQGGNYPSPEWKESLASMASYMWLGSLALNFFGEPIFNTLGITEKPGFYLYLKENPTAVLGSLFLLNNIASSSLSTGAFEVYLDGLEVYSKLKTGHVPNAMELLEMLKDHGIEP